MLYSTEAINFGGKRILSVLGAALFLVVVFVQLHVTLSHLSVRLTAQFEELHGKASSRTYFIKLRAQRMKSYPLYMTVDLPQNP